MRAGYLTLIIIFFSGCVGPFTPMGPLNIYSSPESPLIMPIEKLNQKQNNISLIPHELIFHKNIFLQVKVKGEDAKDFLHDNWKVFYRGHNISDFFEISSKSTLDETILITKDEIKFPNSFNENEEAEIAIKWSKKGEEQILFWPKAHCPVHIAGANGKDLALRSLGSFSNKAEIFTRLERASKENSINPNFYAGMLAALSGLESEKVSSYKKLGIAQIPYFEAIGLTKNKAHWTKSRRIENLPNTLLIIFLKLGLIDTETDWRLNIEKSLIAGAEYMKNNIQFWQQSGNLTSFSNDQNSFDRLIAASYILGPTVVKGLYDSYGKDWEKLKSQNTTKDLIDLAFSYCSEFSSLKSDFEKEKSN